MKKLARSIIIIIAISALTLFVLSGCEPKPGTRMVVKGEVRDITRPEQNAYIVGDATDLYWLSGAGTLVRRPHAGGVEDVQPMGVAGDSIQGTAWSPNPVTFTRDGVAAWKERGREITIMPKAGQPRRVRLDRRPTGATGGVPGHVPGQVGELMALDDGETLVWDEATADQAHVLFFAVSLRLASANGDAGPIAPRELGRIANTSSHDRSIEPAARGDGFAVTVRTPSTYSVILFDTTINNNVASPREVYRATRSGEDGEPPVMKLGAQHVFVVPPRRSSLDTTLMPLLAIHRTTGEKGKERLIDPKVCGPLAVIDDDPLYISTKERCPGEFPISRRVEMRRHRMAEGRTETIYAVQTGGLWMTKLHRSGSEKSMMTTTPTTMLVDERLALPHQPGSMPTYEYRSALLTIP